MPLSTAVTEVADRIASELSAGSGSRATIGDGTTAFGWVGGMPLTLASFVRTVKAENMTIPITRVTHSATTPVAVVAPGAPKPAAVDIAADTIALQKFAGKCSINLESLLSGDGLLPAITSVLGAGSLLAFEAAAMAALDADSGATASGPDWAGALAAGQAAVLGNGGVPGVCVVSHLDYGTLIGAITGSAGFSANPESAVGSYLGSALHISPKLASGKAYVLDSSSVMAVGHAASPLLITDPYSGAASNTITLVSDLVAAVEVLNPKHVAEVTVTAAMSAGHAERK